ncbi:alpha/beta-hydrolase [Macrolepiota fuliginosa MF-IS2]|uniref:Alpha/beta-hydrolase n=1 Tax=Macrolepiota fuliginosa MF-IS2 TaxID=1400762 RepID=A0A9P6C6U6_9AGAR|nr:alpha/beta-hydrolase [Macrolepiota fuliginosa MF-IS2]
MIDHIFGRPNPSWKRGQVFLVLFFWTWRITKGNEGPPRILWLPRLNRRLQRFTPWQLILSTLTAVYALRNLDKILGLDAPEPLRNLYTPEYFRATWIVTGLDAGFATAMSIRPKWLRDICSLLFAFYYIIFPSAADEKLRRFRAMPTIEMLRATWNKTANPYLRLLQRGPRLSTCRKILLPRPKGSSYKRPVTAYLYFAPAEAQLKEATELILDFPGGGFVAMTPEHHEERLRLWAVSSGKPILSIDYGKAPEYPYPFAIDEVFDVYRLLVQSAGRIIGMSGKKFSVIITGDSAGGTLAVNVVTKIVELRSGMIKIRGIQSLPLPTGMVLTYAALDFNFGSWMSADQLRILRTEQSSNNIPGMREFAAQKDHLHHVSPLSMVPDRKHKRHSKKRSNWKDTLRGFTSGGEDSVGPRIMRMSTDEGSLADTENGDEDFSSYEEKDKPIKARVKYKYDYSGVNNSILRTHSALQEKQEEMAVALKEADTKATEAFGGKGGRTEPIGTRLTMSSRAGYFQDRIISPSMMRAMAILYIGPHRNPDFATDYHISPILTPEYILSQFPPLMIQCGEKDPFVDDNVIFAGRVREAKRARKIELELALSGKSARFGEDQRPQEIDVRSVKGVTSVEEMKRERDRLTNESEYDWVQLVLLADWSHGYLQMPTLLPSAKAVIDDLAEWIDSTFRKYRDLPVQCDLRLDDGMVSEGASDSGITVVSKRRESSGSEGVGKKSNNGSPQLDEVQKQSRIAGHTITEMELVRRRRLQDSHLFD